MTKNRNLRFGLLNVILASSVLLLSQCKKENLETPQAELSGLGSMPEGMKLAATGITSSSYYLVNSLPSGYVKDGSKDYTSYVQAAVTKYSNIVFPGFPILINDTGIFIGSNKTITFQEGSEIRLKGTSKSTYAILRIASASNVTLYNPVIVGDRYSHIGTDGEHGMGIGIWGSSNVSIYNAKVTNCWGDGIYIGQADTRINSKNIIIKDAYLRKNRRDGISIIGVDGLLLDNLYAGYSDGTSPMSGINFEPNNTNSEIKNVRINNPRTEHNGKNGIQIGLARMVGSTNKNVDITIVNHFDTGSPRYAFKVACNPTTTGKLYGTISNINPAWHKTSTETNLYLWLSSNQASLKTAVSSPEIMTQSGSILSWTDTYNSVMKAAKGGVVSVIQEAAEIVDSALDLSEPENSNQNVVFAVNAGGSEFEASNGITYSADKNFKGGSTFSKSTSISNTSDDVLYKSERYGDFSYNVPLADGTYEITFKLSELYHQSSGRRIFDILVENDKVISNLDIFGIAGNYKAYDLVKTVTVTDGTLNIDFSTDIENAKISAFHVIRK